MSIKNKLKKKKSIVSDKISEQRKAVKGVIHAAAQENEARQGPDKKIIVEREEEPEDQRVTAKKIAEIYSSESKSEDMTRIDKRDPGRRKRIIGWTLLILIVVLGATFGGFYFFVNRQGTFSGEKIDINVSTMSAVSSGDEINYVVTINNEEEVGLTDVQLTAQFPAGFTYKNSTPQVINEAKNAWQVSDIRSGSNEKVSISGQLFGDIGATKTIYFTLSYKPSNFNSEFQNKASHSVTINSSILDLELDVPVRLISDKETTFVLKYTNNSNESIERVRIQADYPDDFVIISIEPAAKENNNTWELDSIASKESGEIKIIGSLSAAEGEMREVDGTIGYVDQNGEFHKQIEKTAIILIINPKLELTLTVNDSEIDNVASFGDTLDFKINYVNNSQSEIRGLTMTAEIVSDVLDWDTLTDENLGIVADQSIVWDQTKIKNFTSLKPGDSGELAFTMDLENNIAVKKEDDKNYTVVSNISVNSNDVVDLEDSSLEIESNGLTTKINSRLDLVAEGRYYDDEYVKVGSGPLPPEVGKTTIYRIYWGLTNTTNLVNNIEVTTVLPEDVIWTGRSSVSAGNSFAFDPDSRLVTWQINKIPAHTGQLSAGLEAYFEVAVTPTADDVGQILTLTGENTVTGSDAFSSQELTQAQDIITSELSDDPRGSGKGIVISEDSTNSNSNTNSL